MSANITNINTINNWCDWLSYIVGGGWAVLWIWAYWNGKYREICVKIYEKVKRENFFINFSTIANIILYD